MRYMKVKKLCEWIRWIISDLELAEADAKES